MDGNFSLLDDRWIPVSYVDGHPDEVSLRQLFEDAQKIKGIRGDIPQQAMTMLRLALGILYRAYCVEDPSEEQMRDMWADVFLAGHFDMDILDGYFNEWKDRFFLFGDRPFFQVPELEYVGQKEYDPVSEMIADMPKPEKYLFAMRGLGTTDTLSLPEAARWLVFLQSFDTAGIKTPVKGNTHINKGKIYPLKGFLGTGWLGGIGGVYAEGANLFETLMLNWVLYDDRYDLEYYRLFGNVNDIPVWEKDEVPSADMDDQSSFAGPVQAMTWQSRRIRLVPNEERTRVIGVVNCYGDALTLYNTDGFEKMTAWRRSIPQQKKLGLPTPPHMPVTHDASKALWRGLEPILCVGDDGDFRPGIIRWLEEIRTEVLGSEEHVLNMVTIHAQGMTYGTQSSFFETGIDDNLSLSMMMFRHDYAGIAAVVDVVKRTDKAVTVLTTFVRNLRSAAGEHSGKTQEIADQIRESAYADLDMLFRDRLANFDESQNPVAYSNAWLDEVHRMLLMMGRDYLSQSPVPVFEEHESGRFGVMSAPLAQLLFRGSLNKELGRISD